MISGDSTLRDLENRIFQEAGFSPHILFETARINTVLAMAADRICCGLVPASFSLEEPPGIGFFTLPGRPSWQQAVSYKKRSHLTRAARFLISLISDYWNRELP